MTADVPAGTVKQDPESDAVAVRMRDGLPARWMVVDLSRGGHYVDAAEEERVLEWPDLAARKPAAKKSAARK